MTIDIVQIEATTYRFGRRERGRAERRDRRDEKDDTPAGGDARGLGRGERSGVGCQHPMPHGPDPYTGTCWGTQEADVIIGTSRGEAISGERGDDLIRAGRGADDILGDDYWLGEDENHGGPGADRIVGNLDSEKHFGGRGDDLLVDYKSGKNPDVFRCGPGRDEVTYNKGLDRAAQDCEVLRPVSKGYLAEW